MEEQGTTGGGCDRKRIKLRHHSEFTRPGARCNMHEKMRRRAASPATGDLDAITHRLGDAALCAAELRHLMTRWRKRLVVAGIGLALLAVCVGAASLLVPRLTDLNRVRAKIVTTLAERLHADVHIGAVQVRLLPLPHLVLRDTRLSLPGRLDASVPSASVYPRMLSLLRGRLAIASVHLDAADVRVGTTGGAASGATSPRWSNLPATAAVVLQALGDASARAAPGLVVFARDCRISLVDGAGVGHTFTSLTARLQLPPDALRLDATCASDLAQRIGLHAAVDPTDFRGSAQLTLTHLHPQRIDAHPLAAGALALGDSDVNLDVHLSTDSAHSVRADIDGSIPRLTLEQAGARTTIRGDRVRGAVRLDDGRITVDLEDLRLDQPRAQVAGKLAIDRATGVARLAVRATQIDVAAMRAAAPVITGHLRLTHSLFDVLRGGSVTALELHADGASLAELGAGDGLTIHGQLANGQIHLPGTPLDLEDVSGTATVAAGVLSGVHVAARLDQVRARDGTLQLGVRHGSGDVRADATVEAEARALPALLKRFVANPRLTQPMDRVTDLEGTVSGALHVGGTTEQVTVTVDAMPAGVSGRLPGLSRPVRVDGGHVVVDTGAQRFTATDLQIGSGTSSLSHLSLEVPWDASPQTFGLTVGQSSIVFDEIYPWLTTAGWFPNAAWRPQTITGTLGLESGHVDGPLDNPAAWHIALAGAAHRLTIDAQLLQQHVALRAPVSLADFRLDRDPAATTTASGKFSTGDGLTGSVNLSWSPVELRLRQLVLRDRDSDATLSFLRRADRLELAFAGTLSKRTVDALVDENRILGGELRGDVTASLALQRPMDSRADGQLDATDLLLPLSNGREVRAERLRVRAQDGTITGEATVHLGPEDTLQVHGSVSRASDAFVTALDVSADHLEWAQLASWVQRGDGASAPTPGSSPIPLRGTVRLTAQSFTYGDLRWEPVRATVALVPLKTTVTVTAADLCGVSTPGTITLAPEGTSVTLKPAAADADLDSTLRCFGAEPGIISGRFTLAGQLTATGKPADLISSLRGTIHLRARKGRIRRLGMVAKVLSALSVVSGAVGNIRDMASNELPYDRLELKGRVQGSTILLSEAVFDGPTAKMAATGSVDVRDRTVELTVLVAMLKSVDSVVSHIPVIRGLLGSGLVSVPVKVSGPIGDPEIIPLAPSAVGAELVNVMTRTLKLPFDVIQPLLGGGKKP